MPEPGLEQVSYCVVCQIKVWNKFHIALCARLRSGTSSELCCTSNLGMEQVPYQGLEQIFQSLSVMCNDFSNI
jgi:hypothetical protein